MTMITLRNAWWVTRFRRPVVAGYLSRLSWEAPDGRQAWPTRFPRPRFDLGGARAELIETFDNFTFDEVLRYRNLDARIRRITQLASKIASQAVRENRVMLGAALNAGVTLVEAKEVVYQAVPYVGMAKVFDFIHATKDVLTARGVILPPAGPVHDHAREPGRKPTWKCGTASCPSWEGGYRPAPAPAWQRSATRQRRSGPPGTGSRRIIPDIAWG
ncbi:MAG: carboxymuconolactone decarboxylase family protein [Chromatiaceae bacterium]|nr:carboxymuconolactone decarboxylase family protein [Chromatiaceae bacterium]